MKKIFSLVLASALLATTLAGCGSKTAEAPTTKAPAETAAPADTAAPGESEAPAGDAAASGEIEKDAKLVYWPMWAETEPQGQAISEAIDAFTDATGIEVEVNWAGSRDTRKTLEPALAAGETVDVFDEDVERVNGTWGKYLMDIQAMYDASPLKGNQNSTLIDLAVKLGGGTLKSVPYQPSTFIMFYNKDAFTQAGISAVPSTWDEFMAACEALKGAGIIPLTVDDAYMACLFGFLMDRIAGADTTEAVAAGDFTNEAVLKTAQVLEELIKNGYVDPRAAGNVYPQGQSNMADGSVAMYLNGSWLPNEIKNQTPEDFKWGAFALPQIAEGGDGAESNQYGAQCFAINKDTKYPNAAFALIQWLTSGEWDQKLADASVPMDNNAKWPDQLADAKAVLDSTTHRLNWAMGMENDSNVNAFIKTNMAMMIGGNATAQEFADGFAKIQKSN
ncbi:ABC transporter substrate-binding protein [Hungatella hathewayi]|uniref:ABC transporter substrate-binding protein n=1 Tax=Hungatella hathewayi TaxID=154046 RepID=UPI003567ECC9